MMELIKIEKRNVGGQNQNTTNGRDLWATLKSKRQFGNWIQENLQMFVEDQDYQVFNVNVKNLKGGRPSKE